MFKPNMMIMSDYYKQGHPEFYPENLEYLATYGTARLSRIDGINHMVVWGIQQFAMEYLIDRFNDTFFNKPKKQAVKEVEEFIQATFKCSSFNIKRIEELHDLGYLPVRLWALPEGTLAPIYSQKENPGVVQVPFMMYESTHKDFAWVAEFLESITSCQVWYPMVIATIAKYGYRNTVDKHWKKSVVGQPARTAISEFGFRGAEGSEGAIMASSAFLTSFDKTATCPAIESMKYYYGKDIPLNEIGGGMSSTEHSVMCSNFAVDGDEDTFMLRLFKEIAPDANLSVVSDSYDYWGRIDAFGNSDLKAAILARNGCVYIRGDSGNPTYIICGSKHFETFKNNEEFNKFIQKPCYYKNHTDYCKVLKQDYSGFDYYIVTKSYDGSHDVNKFEPTLADIGTVGALFERFGGYLNEKGYIVLNDKVRAIYGDSITPYLTEVIYTRLEDGGFAANNVALGAGSFSMQAWEEVDASKRVLKPHTRDTFGIAFKATYCEVNGVGHQIFKNPKTDEGSFKRSQRGMVVVKNKEGKIIAEDGYTYNEFMAQKDINLLRPIFENGKMLIQEDIRTIRNRLNPNF